MILFKNRKLNLYIYWVNQSLREERHEKLDQERKQKQVKEDKKSDHDFQMKLKQFFWL